MREEKYLKKICQDISTVHRHLFIGVLEVGLPIKVKLLVQSDRRPHPDGPSLPGHDGNED